MNKELRSALELVFVKQQHSELGLLVLRQNLQLARPPHVDIVLRKYKIDNLDYCSAVNSLYNEKMRALKPQVEIV